MREVKAFIRRKRATDVIKGLRDNDFKSITVTDVEGTGRFTRRDARPSLKFTVTHSKMGMFLKWSKIFKVRTGEESQHEL